MEKEEISLKTLGIIFLLSLVILFGLYYFIFMDHDITGFATASSENPTSSEDPLDKFNKEMIKEPKTAEALKGIVVENFENTLISKFFIIHDKKSSFSKISISDESFKGKGKSLKINYDIVKGGYVIFRSPSSIEDWSEFENLNILIKPGGKKGILRVLVTDIEGDTVDLFNEYILTKTDWHLFKIPLRELALDLSHKGDGEMNLKNIKEYQLHFLGSIEKYEGEIEIFLDSIFLD